MVLAQAAGILQASSSVSSADNTARTVPVFISKARPRVVHILHGIMGSN